VLALSVMKVTLSYARWRGFLPAYYTGFTATCRDESRHVQGGMRYLQDAVRKDPTMIKEIHDTLRTILSVSGVVSRRVYYEPLGWTDEEVRVLFFQQPPAQAERRGHRALARPRGTCCRRCSRCWRAGEPCRSSSARSGPTRCATRSPPGPDERARAVKLQEYWDFFDWLKSVYPASWALGCRDLPGVGAAYLFVQWAGGTVTDCRIIGPDDPPPTSPALFNATYMLGMDYRDWKALHDGYDAQRTVMYRKILLEQGRPARVLQGDLLLRRVPRRPRRRPGEGTPTGSMAHWSG